MDVRFGNGQLVFVFLKNNMIDIYWINFGDCESLSTSSYLLCSKFGSLSNIWNDIWFTTRLCNC